ncbi:MAG: tRNA pseudouridine(54/55) synthase Pus10 [Candidatus Nezhaarchaeota archaeon]|nr:tRNA pseudouridine(54/55) synthase Pus10 [Candidatus Nezhaarchaeota archaeon]
MNILEVAKQLILEAPLCESCLGRCFAKIGRALSNRERGYILKGALLLEAERLRAENDKEGEDLLKALSKSGFKWVLDKTKEEAQEDCYICRGIMDKLQDFVLVIKEALSPYEYATFLLGTKIPGDAVEREDALRAKLSLNYSESLKNDVNRELRKLLSQRLEKRIDFRKPDVIIVVDVGTSKVEVKPSPIFIFGRYLKLKAGIPQNKWYCPRCWGRGCEHCKWTGKLYSTSVEELVADPIKEMYEGKDAKFHGAGREDVDVKVLGRGRPFIVEVREPRRRNVDLVKVEEEVNRRAEGLVEVKELSYSSREEVRRLKLTTQIREKVYLARIKVRGGLSEEEALGLEKTLSGSLIRQRTPLRVLHRRADKVRVKKIYEFKVKGLEGETLIAQVKAQGGLYVKELMTGDEGRTTPSVAELLNKRVEVEELTVLDVE